MTEAIHKTIAEVEQLRATCAQQHVNLVEHTTALAQCKARIAQLEKALELAVRMLHDHAPPEHADSIIALQWAIDGDRS